MAEVSRSPVEQAGHHDDEKDEKTTQHFDSGNLAEQLAVEGSLPSAFCRGHIRLYMCCALIYLTATMIGYDASLMGSINATKNFQDYYSLATATTATGLVFSIYQIGMICASPTVFLYDLVGRKWSIFIGCFGVVASGAFTATAPSLDSFIAARFLLSFFGTIASGGAVLYCVEMAPPRYRGAVAGVYNTLYYLGSIVATFAVYGSNIHLSSTHLNWRLPLWVQVACPGIVCMGLYFVPESPRWLVAKERYAEARAILVYYHADGDDQHPIVDLEMSQITDSLTGTDMTSFREQFNYKPLVSTRSRRYRMMISCAMAWFGQFCGNNIISYYLPIMLKNVGVASTNMQLLLTAIYAICGWIAATIGARVHDLFGRRAMFLGATLGMSLTLAIVAGTAASYEQDHSNKAASSASIAFIYAFGVIFAFGFTPMQSCYPTEVLSNDMRAKGMGVFHIFSGAAGFLNTFVAPTALANIKYWFYVFFVFWDLFEFAFIYFFFVETRGRTLEEMDAVFEAKNPRKASTRIAALATRHGDP